MSSPYPGWALPRSLYVHVPFCPYKCPYCDFVTQIGSEGLIQPYVDAVCTEIERVAGKAGATDLLTVYIGGGTPSLLSAGQVAAILDSASRHFGIESLAEISIEANPGTVTADKLAGYRSAGVNRLSVGAQSMLQSELEALGREHTPFDVVEAVRLAREARFDNVSLDLMYGGPGGSIVAWQETLEHVVDLAPEHLSLYSLIIEPGTKFIRLYERNQLSLPPDDDVADMYDVACEKLADGGFEHYEVANWSRPGKQAVHNLAYWHDEEFFAAGVGAHGYLRPFRYFHVRSTRNYIQAVNAGEDAIGGRDHVGPLDERFETVVMRLRLLQEGVDACDYQERFGESLEERYGETIEELITLGFLTWDGSALKLREAKVPLANEAWVRFLPPSEKTADHPAA